MIDGTLKRLGEPGVVSLVVVGLVLAGASVFFLCMEISTVLAWRSMQAWEQVPADIESVELNPRSSNYSMAYRCAAQYSYEYGGERHTGTRVVLQPHFAGLCPVPEHTYDELVQYRDSGEPFRCYVNPRDSSDSILYREVRWDMPVRHSVLVAMLGGAGIGLVIGGRWSLRRLRETERLHTEHAEKPWLWKPEWVAGEIPSYGKLRMWQAVGCAALCNLVALPIGYSIVSDNLLRQGHPLILIMLVIPAVGLSLALWAAYTVLRWFKYGDSVFRMAETPGMIGGKLSGAVEVPANVSPEGGFHLTLSCILTSGRGGRGEKSTVLWRDTRVMARDSTGHYPFRTPIPVAFEIPYECRQTDDSDLNTDIVWKLEVEAATPGIDYYAEFEVPVFKTDAIAAE